jgi:hypothetical protein
MSREQQRSVVRLICVDADSADGARRRIWVGSIVIRCQRFEEMLAFWQSALGDVPQAPPEDGFRTFA